MDNLDHTLGSDFEKEVYSLEEVVAQIERNSEIWGDMRVLRDIGEDSLDH